MNDQSSEPINQDPVFKSVLESISDGVVIADQNGQIILLNRAAEEITGLNPGGSLPIERWGDFFGCYHADGTTKYLWDEVPIVRAIRGDVINDEELILQNESLPSARWVTVSGRPINPDLGVNNGAVIVFRDITEKKNAEAELYRSNLELQQFAYIAAHDLQEPLRTITGFLNLLSQKYENQLDEKAHRYINHAVGGAARLQKLVSDMLVYSRLSTKQPKMVQSNCNEIVASVLADLQLLISESGAQITYEELPTINADESQLRQLFQNLINNSIKYRGSDSPLIDIKAEQQGINWVITVSDNGIGFEMEYAERIFLIFQRLHGRDVYQGTGIGLALCKRIVERHRGRIWATSQPGRGSQFHFTIPLSGNTSGETNG